MPTTSRIASLLFFAYGFIRDTWLLLCYVDVKVGDLRESRERREEGMDTVFVVLCVDCTG